MSTYLHKFLFCARLPFLNLLTLLVMDLKAKAERTKVLPGVSVAHLEKALEIGFNQAQRSTNIRFLL